MPLSPACVIGHITAAAPRVLHVAVGSAIRNFTATSKYWRHLSHFYFRNFTFFKPLLPPKPVASSVTIASKMNTERIPISSCYSVEVSRGWIWLVGLRSCICALASKRAKGSKFSEFYYGKSRLIGRGYSYSILKMFKPDGQPENIISIYTCNVRCCVEWLL